jgi:hypothetical protein
MKSIKIAAKLQRDPRPMSYPLTILRRAAEGFAQAEPTYSSQILGPTSSPWRGLDHHIVCGVCRNPDRLDGYRHRRLP